MINPKRLVEMARKWQEMAAKGRRRITLARSDRGAGTSNSPVDKGHFVVYAQEGTRFVLPLAYLNTPIFKELLRMAEDEFGMAIDGPIRLPCDATLMHYVFSLLTRDVPKEVEKALLVSLSTICRSSSSSSFHQGHGNQQALLVHCF